MKKTSILIEYLSIKRIKLLSLLLIIFIVFSLTGFAPVSSVNISIENITVLGEKMSIEDYKKLYGRPVPERIKKDDLNSYQDISIHINSINIVDDTIKFDYKLENYQDTNTGVLYNSSRNLNNIVAVFDDSSKYKVLFFEINKGNQEINLLYNNALNNKPHIKIYLSDSKKNIYLFETELPEQFSSITVQNSEHCDIYKDYLWYVNILDGYKSEVVNARDEINKTSSLNIENNIDSNEIIKQNISIAANKPYTPKNSDVSVLATSKSTEPIMWGAKTIYEMTVTNGVDQTTYKFYPYGYIRGSNVSNVGNSTWWGSLEVSESTATKMIGSPSKPTITYGINRFGARNVKISIVCGNKTMMIRSFIDGKTKTLNGKQKTTGQKITAKVLKKAFSSIPYGKTASEILSWLSLIKTPVSNEVTLGSNGISLNSTYTSAAKVEVDSDYVFNKFTEASGGGHKIIMQVDLTRTTNSSNMTTGAVRINYDVYTDLHNYYDNHQVQKSFRYSNVSYK